MCLIYILKAPSEKQPIIALVKYQEGDGGMVGPYPLSNHPAAPAPATTFY